MTEVRPDLALIVAGRGGILGPMMHLERSLGIVVLPWGLCAGMLALGCGEQSGAPDAGTDSATGSASDSATDTEDSGTEGPLEDCTFEITPAGGTLDACGLRISAPPDSVSEATMITVTHPALDAKPPEGLGQDSAVFSLTTGSPDFSFLKAVVVHFPQETGSADVWVAKHFPEYGSWGVFETCFKSPTWGGLRMDSLGSFTVLTDVAGNDAPSSGHVDVTWDGQTATFDLEGVGYAHYLPLPSGDRSVELYAARLVDGNYETFKLNFGITADGVVEGALASFMASDQMGVMQSWINYDGITPPSKITLSVAELQTNLLVGDMSGTLFGGVDPNWVELGVSATFNTIMTRHFWPTDDPCLIP